MTRWDSTRLLLAVSLLGFVACKKAAEEPPPEVASGQYPPPGYGAGEPGAGAAEPSSYGPSAGYPPVSSAPNPNATSASNPTGGAQPVPPLGQVLSDPVALQNLITGALAGGAAMLGAVTGGELAPIEQGIANKAKSDARGMVAEGSVMSARLQAGGHAQASFSLSPGKCYAFVGFGGIGVLDFQINLLTAPPLPPQVLAQSAAGRADPTLGPNEQCVSNPYPMPMVVNVDMHVIRGQGLVGVRAYRR